MSMGLLRLLRGNKASAPVARERLQILLAHERGLRGQPDLLGVLRASNVGSPVTLNNPASAPARAYADATKRLLGETIPMTVPSERKGLMNLLRRRAA